MGALLFPGAHGPLLVAVACSELIFAPVITQVAFGYAAKGRMAHAAAAPAVLSMVRVAGVAGFIWLHPGAGIDVYVYWHLCASAVAALLVWLGFRSQFGAVRAWQPVAWSDLRTGAGFSSLWASGLALGSLDKTTVLRLAGSEAGGHYTAAHRFATLAALPVEAMAMAVMPRLFRAGAGGATHPRLIQWLLAATIGYGAAAGSAVWWASAWLPWLLGENFDDAVPALKILSFFVPLYCLRCLAAHLLLGFDRKRWRVASEVIALHVMLGLMILLVPEDGAVGAAYALLGAELLLVAMLWGGWWFRGAARPADTESDH
jgi:O-antigen/teichoic acid export membrane protein